MQEKVEHGTVHHGTVEHGTGTDRHDLPSSCCNLSSPLLQFQLLRFLLTCCMHLQIVLNVVWLYGFRYFYYPSLLLAIMLVGTSISVGLTYRQLRSLATIFSQCRLVPHVRKGYVRATVAKRLVPGDVIVVQQGIAVCDMVLLRGNCLIEDSRLSGEVGTALACAWPKLHARQ